MSTAAQELFGLQEAFLARVSANPAAVRKLARWQERGERYMRAVSFQTDQRMVAADHTLQRATLSLIEAVFPAVADAFNSEMVPFAREAFDKWPKDTGVSKSLLALEFFVEGTERTQLRASFSSRAWYSMFIRRPVVPKRFKKERPTAAEVKARQSPTPPQDAGRKKKKTRGVLVVQELVWKPGEAAADRMLPLVAEALA